MVSNAYDPNPIRPLAGLSATQSTTAERLGLPPGELEQLSAGLSEGFAQLLGSVIVRYDEAVGELSLYR
ncbi:MAG: hypothetical protein NVSMB29_10550 [Candidatus Dormibacteria bacterium]